MAAKKDDKDPGEQASESVVEAGRQTRRATESTAESMAETGMSQASDMGRRQTEQVRALMGSGTRLYSDLGEVSRDDVDTFMQTGARLAKGVQDMSWEVMNYTQQSLQLSLKTANDLMTCRTVEDMLNVHRNFMRQSVDTFLQESARLLDMSSGITNEVVPPMQQQNESLRH